MDQSASLTKRQPKRLRKKAHDNKGQESARKRSREEQITPSPNVKGLVKIPRTDAATPKSYSQAITLIKMAVVKKSHPAKKLTTVNIELIHKTMDEAIELPEASENEGSQIKTSGLIGSALILN